MSATVQVGSILMKEWPAMTQPLTLDTEPCSGRWELLKVLDGFDLDRKIHAAGWNFFFMAAEVKVMFFGTLSAAKIQSAVERILQKVKLENFNGLEITEIVAKHFLGVPYITVAAHSRHMQQSCSLDSPEVRRMARSEAEWATG
jgi:hypothetical protein